MQIEAYFDFLADDDIRLKGSRIGIESILYAYIHQAQPPEVIQHQFPTLTLEQVYATILYYLQHREDIDRYMADWLAWGKNAREAQQRNPPPVIARLKALQAERQKSPKAA